jgi:hypothetical protein
MRHLLYPVVAVVSGFGLSLLFYMVGSPLVDPALYLARLFAVNRGGDTMLGPYFVANTALCAVLTYAVLYLAERVAKTIGK